MEYVIQKESNEISYDFDILLLKDVIHRKLEDTYTEMSLKELKDISRKELREYIPVGSIQFVEAWLRRCHRIDRINPIEIPKFMRTGELVKRDYHIVPFKELPKGKDYFIKDVSRLKSFTYIGDPAVLFEDRFEETVPRDHLYQVSEKVDIRAEYRVYVIDMKIVSISWYDGDPKVFPDINVIEKANRMYMARPDYPRSLTIDVMVSQYGTEIIEIHPFISVGLYSTLWGNNLTRAIRDGINYVLKHNTLIELS